MIDGKVKIQSLLCVWDLFFRYWVPVKKNPRTYALIEFSFYILWIQSLYDMESIQVLGGWGLQRPVVPLLAEMTYHIVIEQAVLALKMIHLHNLSFEVRSILVLFFWCNCPQNCCNMPIKQLDSSDRFYQNLFRSGPAFKSLQSSSIKMTMWCPFISSPWMVYPIWHSNCQ